MAAIVVPARHLGEKSCDSEMMGNVTFHGTATKRVQIS